MHFNKTIFYKKYNKQKKNLNFKKDKNKYFNIIFHLKY